VPILAFTDALPESHTDLMAALGSKGVQLESVLVRAPLVFCTISVLNISYEKTVRVRVTCDGWASSSDVTASYFPGSSDGRADRFSVRNRLLFFIIILLSFGLLLFPAWFPFSPQATFSVPNYNSSCSLQFAICYITPKQEFWDNNGGANYHVAMTLPPPTAHLPPAPIYNPSDKSIQFLRD
jgi:hypothetical protein